MKIGVLSDTHGHVVRTTQAIKLLHGRGARVLVHCGDLGSESVLWELTAACMEKGMACHVAIGNVDYADGLAPAAQGLQLGRFLEFEFHGKQCAVLHGDDHAKMRETLAAQRYDYVFTGHTHEPSKEWRGRTCLVNPGAVRGDPGHVALLDMATGQIETLVLTD